MEGESPLTKDNNILGEFRLHDIPPGPAGSIKFEDEFSIDANGILTVTTTDVQTGKKESMTLDCRTSGRMSPDEVKEVIARAERMREADQRETERVLARTALETFCRELKFASSWNPTESKSQMLMGKAQRGLVWLKQNKEASVNAYQLKLQHLERVSGKVGTRNNNNYGASNIALETCFSSAERCLSQSDIPGAFQWFFKAYKEAGSTEREKRYQAVLRISQVCREFANKETDRGKINEKFIYQGASLLVLELKAGAKTTSSLDLATELGKLKEVFFNQVSQPSKKNHFLCNHNV